MSPTNEANAESHADDANVFDGAVGQHTFEVAVFCGIHNAVEARDDAQDQEDDANEEGSLRAREHGAEAKNAVDTSLDDDARHKCGDVARCGGVCKRKPRVEWYDASLEAKASNEEGHGNDLLGCGEL